MNGLPENEYIEVENRLYPNPQLRVDEASTFIDNLRNAQQGANTEIFEQTEALGTDIPSNLGGLTGGEGYWTSRYQTPQTLSVAQNLRTAAQAAALNQALANEQEMWKNRYQQAYRNYQKSAYDRANRPTTTTQSPDMTNVEPDITTNTTTVEVSDITTEQIAKSRYQKLLMKYLRAGYPTSEAEARAKEDFGKSIDVDAPVEPYGGQ